MKMKGKGKNWVTRLPGRPAWGLPHSNDKRRCQLSARSLVQTGLWQVFWLVAQKSAFPLLKQWHFAFCFAFKRINLQQRGLPRIFTGVPF